MKTMRIATLVGSLAALVLISLTPKAASSEGICSREEIANTGCMGAKDCLYPDPNNCNGFIQCVPRPDGSGSPQPMPCPGSLEWNNTQKECVFPEKSTCGSSGHKPHAASAVSTAAAVPAYLKDVCSKQNLGVYADQKRCDCFYECDKNHAIHYECCKPGLLYQVKHHICAAPSEVQCGNRTPPAKSK